jgi:hypothetical protein
MPQTNRVSASPQPAGHAGAPDRNAIAVAINIIALARPLGLDTFAVSAARVIASASSSHQPRTPAPFAPFSGRYRLCGWRPDGRWAPHRR